MSPYRQPDDTISKRSGKASTFIDVDTDHTGALNCSEGPQEEAEPDAGLLARPSAPCVSSPAGVDGICIGEEAGPSGAASPWGTREQFDDSLQHDRGKLLFLNRNGFVVWYKRVD